MAAEAAKTADILESVLSFEEDCHKEGYEEGYQNGLLQGHLEGRELGIQTGFQRFFTVGILKGRVSIWNELSIGNEQRGSKALDRLEEYLDISDLSNNPTTVADVDLRVRKAKTQAKIVLSALGGPPLEIHDQKLVYQREDSIEDL